MEHIQVPNENCNKCHRLELLRSKNKQKYPAWHNAPVNSFGDVYGSLLIVGLAPGLKGANRTGIPFTGDNSGDLLFKMLSRFNFSINKNLSNTEMIKLKNCRITNAVRCLPPSNKPIQSEVKNCSVFLKNEIDTMKNLKFILALGKVAHDAIISVFEKTKSQYKFGHNNQYNLGNIKLIDSYHCSRYNLNTRRLTVDMFRRVFQEIVINLD